MKLTRILSGNGSCHFFIRFGVNNYEIIQKIKKRGLKI